MLAAGSSGMAVTPSSDSPQPTVAATFDSTQPAGTIVHLVDSDGTIIASFESTKDFSSVVLSSEAIVDGEEYDVYVGGSVTGTSVGGLADSGSLDGATVSATATAGEELSGGMGGGGMGGGQPPQGER